MPKYRCDNEECTMKGQTVSCSTQLRIVGDQVIDTSSKCPKCGQERIAINPEGMPTVISGTDDQRLKGGYIIK